MADEVKHSQTDIILNFALVECKLEKLVSVGALFVEIVYQLCYVVLLFCNSFWRFDVVTWYAKGEVIGEVSSYLPLVPTNKIAKMFNDEVAELEPLVPAGREVDVAAVH
ncbi:hypothetical protein QYF36_016351 [Acer negundo]|nr:hypothetical protein QYF36_016351 [Acer negundo]